jgi:hypothetical protein
MNAYRITTALLVLLLAASPGAAAVTQQLYQINPGGVYQYFPSGFVPIPGGMPSESQLDFGIGGTFVYEFDTAVPSAKLKNLNLFLTGNEAIQASPPPVSPVTADRVETYLASHTFVTDFIGGLVHLKSSVHPNLKLTDGVNGGLAIFGGYDIRPVDGDAVNFQFSARAIPEPAAISLFAMAAFAAALRRREH